MCTLLFPSSIILPTCIHLEFTHVRFTFCPLICIGFCIIFEGSLPPVKCRQSPLHPNKKLPTIQLAQASTVARELLTASAKASATSSLSRSLTLHSCSTAHSYASRRTVSVRGTKCAASTRITLETRAMAALVASSISCENYQQTNQCPVQPKSLRK